MDFLKILRSFEEFIFEAASWLLFYPRTLARIIARPLAAMAYSDREQADSEDNRYDDALSPPLLLLMTVVLVNLLGVALHVPVPEGASPATKAIFNSPQNLAFFRAVLFCLVPLVAAATLVKRLGQDISRRTLRPPFYAQCFLAAPCALVVSLGGIVFQRHDIPNAIGGAVMLTGTIWFFAVQTRWFASRLGIAQGPAFLIAGWAFVRALAYMLALLAPLAFI